MRYDYLITGAGLFGAVFAHEAVRNGKSCLVIDKKSHIAGQIYTKQIAGIEVHCYGAHIFHTNNRQVWEYVNRLAEFRPYINAPIANYHDELYNLPFNMNTFYRLWGVRTPMEAKEKIRQQVTPFIVAEPKNLEEQALSLVGPDIYEKLVKGYTEKQWGRDCRELPAFLIKRLPIRFTFDNNYFDDRYQGIPERGYTDFVERLLEGAEVRLKTDYFDWVAAHPDCAKKTVYTGPIDQFYGYCYGSLAYRSLRFETEELHVENYQGNAVVNYTAREVPYTRVIEHKHFAYGQQQSTVVTREYPANWEPGREPYYPVNDEINNALYQRYADLAAQESRVLFGGRLASYRYYNMDQVVNAALQLAKHEFQRK